MQLLIIGGTRFLGYAAALAALDREHDVTLFHRGLISPDGIPGCTSIIGDRKGDLSALTARWDAVIDTSGYLPREVRKSAEHLRALGTTKYLFVSSVNAYRSPIPPACTEDAPAWDNGDESAEEMTLDTYGPLKAACERVVQDVYAQNAFIIRSGLIAGTRDSTDRFTYWVRRVAAGGTVLIPQDNGRKTQVIDVQDLADWMVRMVEDGPGGRYNATGPAYSLSEIVETCKRITGSNARFKGAPESFILEHRVEPWSDLPLWLPRGEEENFDTIDSSKARAHGLRYSTLAETVADTYAWDRRRDHSVALKAGLTPERETELLALL